MNCNNCENGKCMLVEKFKHISTIIILIIFGILFAYIALIYSNYLIETSYYTNDIMIKLSTLISVFIFCFLSAISLSKAVLKIFKVKNSDIISLSEQISEMFEVKK